MTLIYFAGLGTVVAHLPLEVRAGVAFALVFVGYFAVRFFGQGVLTSASRNILLAWFERRRGFVSGLRGVFVSLGFSLAPPILAALIAAFAWQGALWVLAATCGLGFALLALLLARDAPEPCGLQPDGEAPTEHGEATLISGASLAVARRAPVFWLYSLGLALHAMFGTAVTFHVVSIFAEVGRDAGQAFGFFLPMALVSTTTTMAASWASDRTPLRLVARHAHQLSRCLLGAVHAGVGKRLLVAGAGTGLWRWPLGDDLEHCVGPALRPRQPRCDQRSGHEPDRVLQRGRACGLRAVLRLRGELSTGHPGQRPGVRGAACAVCVAQSASAGRGRRPR